jgi:hypothetical protein
MGRIRRHLTYANVMASIAVFLVLGGGGAYALSGSNTVQSDDLGPGAQVRAPDVAANAVNGSDVADDSLGGADIIEESLSGRTRKLIYNAPASPAGPITTIATLDPYTIKGQCLDIRDIPGVHAALYVNGPAGTADWTATETFDDARGSAETGSRRVPIPASRNTLIFTTFSTSAHFARIAGTAMLRSGPNLIQVDVNAVADSRSPRRCYLYGTATKALD